MLIPILWIYFGSAMIAFAIALYGDLTAYRPKFPWYVNSLLCLIPIFNSLFVLSCLWEFIEISIIRIKGRLK